MSCQSDGLMRLRMIRRLLRVAVVVIVGLFTSVSAPVTAGAESPGARLYDIATVMPATTLGWTDAQFSRLTRGGADMLRFDINMQAVYRCDASGEPVLWNPEHPWAALDSLLAKTLAR